MVLDLKVATEPTLSVRTFVLREGLSRLFSVDVTARCDDPDLKLQAVVGRPASFSIATDVVQATYPKRSWPGLCRAASLEQVESTGHSTYRFEIVPALWELSQRRNHRVFQHISAPDIALKILGEWSVEAKSAFSEADYPKLPYKVQYGESDFDFMSRLLEEAGLVFFFAPDAEGTCHLTLADRLESGTPRAEPIPFADNPSDIEREEFVTQVRLGERVRTETRVITDFDLRRPTQVISQTVGQLTSQGVPLEHYEYRPGGFLVDAKADGSSPRADDGGASRHDDGAGQSSAARSLAAIRNDRWTVEYRTNILDSWPGRILRISGHPHDTLDESKPVLVVEFTIEGEAGEVWSGRAKAVSQALPYRPPVRTRRPRARVQSATVVGQPPIDTDEFGRVKVRFPWDRGEGSSSTVWLRVSHAWAGGAFGFIKHPRVGEEVLVDFLEGDPEQPVVVGRLFNQTNPVVNVLPGNQTQSAWLSQSTGSAGGNEILLEDQKGEELLYGQAAKDLRRLVKHDDTSTIVHDRSKTVGSNEVETTEGTRTQVTDGDRVENTSGDRTTATVQSFGELVQKTATDIVEGARLVSVGGDLHVITQGTKREQSTADTNLKVGGDRKESVGGTDSQGVVGPLVSKVGTYEVNASGPNGTIHLFAGSPIVIESSTDATFKGSGGFVKVDSGGVTILGVLVLINDGGSPGSLPAASPSAPDSPTVPGKTPDPPAG